MKKKLAVLFLILCCTFGIVGFSACGEAIRIIEGIIGPPNSVSSVSNSKEENSEERVENSSLENSEGSADVSSDSSMGDSSDGSVDVSSDSSVEDSSGGNADVSSDSSVDDSSDGSVDGSVDNSTDSSIPEIPVMPTEGLVYALSEDESYYVVTGMGEVTDTDIVIPDTYEELPVKGITARAFLGKDDLTSVTIPDMYENGLSDRLHAPTPDIITVPAINEITENNFPMVASGTDETVLSGQSIIGGVNSVSLAA